VSRIIEYEGRGSFRKCIPESELDDENMLICSSPEDGPAQFEIQVPKIKRHKYLKDERKYSLISAFDSTNPGIFSESSCLQTTESDHFVTFRGPLDGSPDCPINQLVDFDGSSLFDVYQAVIGYDDLYDFIGDRQVTYRKGSHYKFECKGNSFLSAS